MNISTAIKNIARQGLEIYLRVCTVDEVNEDTRTIDCTPIDEGAPILGVNLQADQNLKFGVVSFPAKGSDVLVGFINPAVAVVLLTTEITKSIVTIGSTEITVEDNAVSLVTEKVKADISADSLKLDIDGTTLEMNGDKSVWNGGSETTANATDLKKQLTTMSGRIDTIIDALKNSKPVAQDGGAAYQTGIVTVLSTIKDKEDFSGMIDDKIKH